MCRVMYSRIQRLCELATGNMMTCLSKHTMTLPELHGFLQQQMRSTETTVHVSTHACSVLMLVHVQKKKKKKNVVLNALRSKIQNSFFLVSMFLPHWGTIHINTLKLEEGQLPSSGFETIQVACECSDVPRLPRPDTHLFPLLISYAVTWLTPPTLTPVSALSH